jgi:hypothetical protein
MVLFSNFRRCGLATASSSIRCPALRGGHLSFFRVVGSVIVSIFLDANWKWWIERGDSEMVDVEGVSTKSTRSLRRNRWRSTLAHKKSYPAPTGKVRESHPNRSRRFGVMGGFTGSLPILGKRCCYLT